MQFPQIHVELDGMFRICLELVFAKYQFGLAIIWISRRGVKKMFTPYCIDIHTTVFRPFVEHCLKTKQL